MSAHAGEHVDAGGERTTPAACVICEQIADDARAIYDDRMAQAEDARARAGFPEGPW